MVRAEKAASGVDETEMFASFPSVIFWLYCSMRNMDFVIRCEGE